MGVTLMFQQDLIYAKQQYLQDLISRNPYLGWQGGCSNYARHVQRSLANIPEQLHSAAVALFYSVVYLPRLLLDETWREIALDLQIRGKWLPSSGFENSLFLAVDDPGLITGFTRTVGITGREDYDVNPGYGTASRLIDDLYNFVSGYGHNLSALENVQKARSKKWWILLTDNAITGSSAKNELEKLRPLMEILCHRALGPCHTTPKILLGAQIITEQALKILTDLLPQENIFYGLKFDNRFRVNSDSCALFSQPSTLTQVRRLCEWFGDTWFLAYSKGPFKTRLTLHRKKGGQWNYAYGWRDSGYTIVTQENCLSNSLPILCYSPSDTSSLTRRHTPPFPRIESRRSHKTSNYREKIEKLRHQSSLSIMRWGFAQLEHTT